MHPFKKIPRIIVILIILCTLGSHVQQVYADSSPAGFTQKKSFNDYGYGDRTAYGMFGALEYYFPVPENLVMLDGSQLDLMLSYSPLLKSNRSTMTIVVNGIAVHSTRLDETNPERTEISVDLPIKLFQDEVDRAEGLVILVQFFMRLTDLVCEETNNPALWATVHHDSILTLNADTRPIPNDLALMPYPFLIKNDDQQAGITFSFSGPPSSTELNTALQVSTYFGEVMAQDTFDINVIQNEAIAPDEPTIAVGFSPEGLSTSAPAEIALQSSGNQPVLSIFGESPLLGAYALRHPELNEHFTGQRVGVYGHSLALIEAGTGPWQSGAATFWQLGASEQVVQGVGQQTLSLFFKRPPGWELTHDKIYLDLNLTPSPMLSTNQSGVRVKINGIEVGAISFSDKPDQGDFYRINLPASLLNVSPEVQYTDDLFVELVFSHQLRQTACEPIYAENAWTTVHANSYFYFPHSKHALPDLSLFPYPFLDPGDDDPVVIVLPSEPTDDEIAATLMIGQVLGKNLFNNRLDIEVYFAGDLDEILSNAILIGTPARNQWIHDAEAELEKPRQGLVQPAVSRDAIGNLKQLNSPWSGNHWLLIVSGEQGLTAVAKSLNEQLPSASVIAVRKDHSMEPVFRDVRGPRIPEPYRQVRPTLIPKPETWQIVAGVLGVTALVVFVIILVYRRKSK